MRWMRAEVCEAREWISGIGDAVFWLLVTGRFLTCHQGLKMPIPQGRFLALNIKKHRQASSAALDDNDRGMPTNPRLDGKRAAGEKRRGRRRGG